MSDLRISIGADNAELNRALAQAEGRIDAFVSKVNKIGEVGDALTSLGGKLTAGLTLPITALGAASIKAYGDIQALEKGLESVMGSADRAQSELTKLKEVAKLPGLGLKEAVSGSINLQAIGISADKSRNILQQFGNAVATVGKGRPEFERAIYGVQQLANTDFPLGEDLNIIKDALPQVSNLLKEAFGTSRSDELAKMGVSSQQVLDTILEGLGKLPRVSGGIKGAFENLSDSMQTSLGRIGKIIDKNLNLEKIIDGITSFVDKVVTAFENLSPTFQNVILGVAGFAAALGPVLVAVGGFLTLLPQMVQGFNLLAASVAKAGGMLALLINPITLVTAGIIALGVAVVSNWDKITPYLQGTLEYFQRLYKESTVFRLSVQGLGFAFNALGMIAVEVVKNIWQNFKTLGKGLLETFAGVGGVIEGALTLDWDKVKAGYARGIAGIANSVVGIAANSVNSFNTVLSNLDKLEKKWSNLSLDNINIKMPGLENKAADEIEKKVTQGAEKAKSKPIKVELPDVEPIEGGKKGLYALGKIFGTPVEMENYINSLIDTTTVGFGQLSTTLTDEQIKLFELKASFNDSLKNLIESSVPDAIGNAFGVIGEAIGSGGNVINAFAQSILSSLGGFISQMGGLLIKYGTLAVIKGKLDLAIAAGGPVAIAAGTTAIAVGAALKVAGAAIGAFAQKGFGGGSVGTSTGANYGGTQSYSSNYSSGGGNFGGEVVFRISGNDLVGVLSRNQDRNVRVNAG